MELERREDWRSRLSAELERQRRFDLSYGERDCFVTMVGGVVKALTGKDITSKYAGRYSNLEEAQGVIEEEGCKSLVDFTEKLLPRYEHPSQAQIGDVGLVKDGTSFGYAYCIVDASGVIVLADGGHGRLPREAMVEAYKVG